MSTETASSDVLLLPTGDDSSRKTRSKSKGADGKKKEKKPGRRASDRAKLTLSVSKVRGILKKVHKDRISKGASIYLTGATEAFMSHIITNALTLMGKDETLDMSKAKTEQEKKRLEKIKTARLTTKAINATITLDAVLSAFTNRGVIVGVRSPPDPKNALDRERELAKKLKDIKHKGWLELQRLRGKEVDDEGAEESMEEEEPATPKKSKKSKSKKKKSK